MKDLFFSRQAIGKITAIFIVAVVVVAAVGAGGGYFLGQGVGHEIGYKEGYEKAVAEAPGYEKGYDEGYKKGYEEGKAAPPEDTVWAGVVERGKIRVGSSPDWPPYEFLDPVTGEFAGFEVELMEMIAERLGLEVEWIEMGFDLIIPEVKDKAIDLGVSGFSITPERLEVIQYTMPHSITEGQIIMLKGKRDELGITKIDSLGKLDELGITCGTGVGTTQEAELDEQAPGALRTYDDFWAALDAMKIGAIDSVYAETPVTSDWILAAEKAGEEPIVVIYKRPYWPVAFVAHLDSDVLVAKITGALAEITAEGKVDELKAKWRC